MKKINIFGKSVPVFVLVILAVMGVVSASIVAYVSNTVTTTVSVASPIELQIGSTWNNLGLGTLDLGSIIGGETVQFYVSTENKANVPISGIMWNVVSNPDGVTCADFDSISAEVLHPDGTAWFPTSVIGCVAIVGSETSVRMITTPTETWTWASSYKDIAHITVTFNEASHGTYTVSSYVKPVTP
jgi:hypothetical protein